MRSFCLARQSRWPLRRIRIADLETTLAICQICLSWKEEKCLRTLNSLLSSSPLETWAVFDLSTTAEHLSARHEYIVDLSNGDLRRRRSAHPSRCQSSARRISPRRTKKLHRASQLNVDCGDFSVMLSMQDDGSLLSSEHRGTIASIKDSLRMNFEYTAAALVEAR